MVTSIHDTLFSLSGFSVVAFIVISVIGFFYIVLTTKKARFNNCQKILNFILIFFDPLIKIGLYFYIKYNAEFSIHENIYTMEIFLGIVMISEYLVLNILWLISHLTNYKHTENF